MLTLALLSPLCQPVQAGQQFATYAEAQAKVTDTGYIVFIYPAGWDRYGEKLCKKLIADSGVRQASADAALLLAPIYQKRTEADNAKAQQAMGSLHYPGDMSDISYPAIVFYEKGGRQYATIHGRQLMRATPEQVATLIKKRLEAKKSQDKLLQKAHAATDPGEKNRLFLAASRVEGLEWPGGLQNAMRQADPGDTHGYLGVLNFGFGPQQGESMQDFLKRLDAVLDNKNYSPDQKQRACAIAIGHVRRTLGTIAGGPLITKYGRIMKELNPKSALGLSAPVVMRDWVKNYRYGQGWSPEVIPGADAPVLMQDVPMSKPGTYHVSFKITTGRDPLHVKKLRLLDGSRAVAEDSTPRSITWSQTQQTFTIQVKKNVKNPVLEITFGNAADKRSTWGDITVSAQ